MLTANNAFRAYSTVEKKQTVSIVYAIFAFSRPRVGNWKKHFIITLVFNAVGTLGVLFSAIF